MPTAKPFNAPRVRNGFPMCAEKVDMADRGDGSPHDYWSTLGGVTKDSPTPTASKIQKSFRNAMKLYWNLYSVTALYSEPGIEATLNLQADDTFDEEDFDLGFGTSASAGSPQPLGRVCGKRFGDEATPPKRYGFYMGKTFDPRDDELDPATIIIQSDIYGQHGGIVRMYNGDTSDEANFVGYGIKSSQPEFEGDTEPWFTGPGGLQNEAISVSSVDVAAINLRSYISFDGGMIGDVVYKNFEGMDFVAVAANFIFGDDGSGNIEDAANLQVKYEDSENSFILTLSALGFYDY